jgi:hypothetical protein
MEGDVTGGMEGDTIGHTVGGQIGGISIALSQRGCIWPPTHRQTHAAWALAAAMKNNDMLRRVDLIMAHASRA